VGGLKICFLMYQGNMFSGGQGVYTYYLTRELARLGHEVHLIVGPPTPDLGEGVILHQLKTHSYWSYFYDRQEFLFGRNPLSHFHPVNFYDFLSTRIALSSLLVNFSVRAYLKLRELWPQHHFDVVHDNQTLSYGIWLMRLSGFPVVATVHHPLSIDLKNALQQAASLYEKGRRILWSPWIMQQLVARRLDRVIVVSHASARSVHDALGVPNERLRVVHNGIDTEVFRPLEGVERRPNEILYVGNSEDRNKGARYLLEALDMLKEEMDFHVTFVDNVKWRLKLAPRLVRDFGLSSRVHFTGRVSTEELVRLYNQATLVVSPSLYEGFGLPAAEAMSCGRPILATTGGAFPEVVDHGQTGWLVPPADSRALADAIRMLLGAPDLRERLGRAGRQAVLDRFNWTRAAHGVLDVYEEAIAAHRAAPLAAP
jgi:glycosyltransferase involved in cell wall biosynthesis